MTATGRNAARSDRWLRAAAYGLLAELSTIVTIIVIVMAYRYVFARGESVETYKGFGERAGAVIGIVGVRTQACGGHDGGLFGLTEFITFGLRA